MEDLRDHTAWFRSTYLTFSRRLSKILDAVLDEVRTAIQGGVTPDRKSQA
ncbi:MAG: hypothetical protein GY860_23920 [Desulfobacteraceae bacterium]|nr:hypothetical protein [Desulfobacteraceae bacterium]